jgi:hypothetical protein
MTRAVAAIAVMLTLVAAPSALADEKPMGWFATSVRSVFIFHSCTERLKEKFKIGPLNGLEVTNMNTDAKRADGAMDVRFEAITTEKKTARKTHFSGVCHVGREGETRIDARIVSQRIDGVVRRTNKAG